MKREAFFAAFLSILSCQAFSIDIPKLEKEIEGIRGLKFKSAVEVQKITEKEMQAVIRKELLTQIPENDIPKYETALKTFRLIPEEMDLRKTMESLLNSQVVGLYDPKSKKLYVVDPGGGSEEDDLFGTSSVFDFQELFIAHELTHALTDQNFGLLESLKLEDATNEDRQSAGLAVAEGDATLVMFRILGKRLNIEGVNLGDMTEMSGGEGFFDEFVGKGYPRFLRETLLFSYLKGLAFVSAVSGDKNFAPVDGLYKNPPESTEQILHPGKYLQKNDPPAAVSIIVPKSGAAVIKEGTWGEFATEIILREWGIGKDAARLAAEGWGGDRYIVLRNNKGEAYFLWKSVWDTEKDAAEFESAVSKDLRFIVSRTGREVYIESKTKSSVKEFIKKGEKNGQDPAKN
jgi:hypothetical protein